MTAPDPNQPIPNRPISIQATLAELVERARSLIVPGSRRILGVTGSPGAGKSTLCAALLTELGPDAALVGMDGFHLANEELTRLGRRERKGAPDTFDMGGYAALLERLGREAGEDVYGPVFNRDLEESIGSAVMVPAKVPLILTEGNYLLLEGGWARARATLDEVWFLELPEEVRLERLIRRHEAHGRSPAEAAAWVRGVDQRNAVLIEASRTRASMTVQLTL
ncbi:nucleoside/nucleotide kinase family protein [Deinococcus sp.]|uniref:nucleoside/nucleotide kinase family protein n=1 Tax=Deinococcus sp. TaxID=47478 RepID=UPI0025DE08BC|nr:nucleoside/nucleotide kinase family protein [Deinococcus sp.]